MNFQRAYINLRWIKDNILNTNSQNTGAGIDIILHHGIQPNIQSYRPNHRSIFQKKRSERLLIATSNSRNFTYATWKCKTQFPKHLADAGFYYRGESTIVYCFQCRIRTDVKQWFPGENPSQAHARIKPDCQFVIDNDFKPKVNEVNEDGLIGTVDKKRVDTQQLPNRGLEIGQRFNERDCGRTESNTLTEVAESVPHDAMNHQLVSPLNGVKYKYEELKDLKSRIKTFNKWIYESKQNLTDLAKAGYFYTGESDIVRCFCCDLGLAEWEAVDDPWIEHARHSPSCWFLLHEKGEVFVQEIQQKWKQFYNPKHAEHGDKESRKNTFIGWREDVSQTPEMLADAGFFFTGIEDIVRCHYCDVSLCNWKPDDDPWVEHARWIPSCKYLKLAKGCDYIERITRQT